MGISILITVSLPIPETELATGRVPLGLRSNLTFCSRILPTFTPPAMASVGLVAPSAASTQVVPNGEKRKYEHEKNITLMLAKIFNFMLVWLQSNG